MNEEAVLERHAVPEKASEAATQLDNAFLGRYATFESVVAIIDWLHEEACRMRRRNDLPSFSPLGLRELVAPGRDDLTHVDQVAEQLEMASRRLRKMLWMIERGQSDLAAEARDFVLKVYSLTHAETWHERCGRRRLFA